jgi:hypothetical protein
MSLRLRALLFLAGAAAFALMVAHAGVHSIVANITAVGWLLLPLVALYGVVQVFYAAAWQTVMGAEPVSPPFGRTLAITVSTLALNFITPFVQAGGEAFRVAAAGEWLGRRRAGGSVMLYTMIHALSSLLLWFSALILVLVVLPHRAILTVGVAALMLVVLGLVAIVLAGHHGGVLGRLFRLLERIPLIRRFTPALERHRAMLEEVDRQITDFHRRAPRRFLLALALDFTGRVIGVGEFYLICRGLGTPVSLTQAYLIGGLLALAINASFFVPFELGSKEAALYFIYHLAGLTPELGVATSVITRVRELAWVGIGVGLVWVGGRRAVAKVGRPPPG